MKTLHSKLFDENTKKTIIFEKKSKIGRVKINSFHCTTFSSQYNRTSDDIKSMIKLAKLNEKHLTDVTQVIYYGEMDNSDDWKLLELNDPLLSAIEQGQVLAFKGKQFQHCQYYYQNIFSPIELKNVWKMLFRWFKRKSCTLYR